MKIGIGADHAGFNRKTEIIEYLTKKGYDVVDFGAHSVDRVDYPDYAKTVSEAVVNKEVEVGLLVCGTGIGMSIAANKVKGIRAALVFDELTARLAKEHNHANVIAFGGRNQTTAESKIIVDAYLNAHEESRHQHRVDKIAAIENGE